MDLQGAIFIVVIAILIIVSVSLGISLRKMATRSNRDTETQTNTRTGNNAQLDRIERSVREGTCVGILAISMAAIIVAGTIDVSLGYKFALYVLGGIGIIYSIIRYYVPRR